MKQTYHERLRETIRAAASLGFRLVAITPKGKLFGPRCQSCGNRIVAGTGELIAGRCGPCDTAYREAA